MKKGFLISGILLCIGIVMINVAFSLKSEKSMVIEEINIRSMATSANMYVKGHEKEEEHKDIKECEMEQVPASIIIPPRIEVYDGMTLSELGDKINRNLGNSYVSGKGELIASYALEKGVDPYIATAILLHETGCRAKCSRLVTQCNNVGGQKGYPGCGGGAYKRFNTLDEGIYGFINNLSKNYFAKGLNTIDKIAPKYCEGNTWAGKIKWYVSDIKKR